MSSRAIVPMRSDAGGQVVYDPVLGTTLAMQSRIKREAGEVPTIGVTHALDALNDPAPNVLRELQSIHSMRDLQRAVGDGVKHVRKTASQYQLGDDEPPPVHIAVVDANPGHTLEVKADRAIRFAYICAFLITLPLAVGLLYTFIGADRKDLGPEVAVVFVVFMIGTCVATGMYVVRVLRARNLALAVLGLRPVPGSLSPTASFSRKGSVRGAKGKGKGKGGGMGEDELKPIDIRETVDLEATCTECGNKLGERCGRFNHTGMEAACPPTVGKCGHVFHFHCVVLVHEHALRIGEPPTCPHKSDSFLWEWKRRDDRDHYTALREAKFSGGLAPGERRGRLGPRRATTGTMRAPSRDAPIHIPGGGRLKRKGSHMGPSHGGPLQSHAHGEGARGKRRSSSRRIEVAPSGGGGKRSPSSKRRSGERRGLSRHASATPAMH